MPTERTSTTLLRVEYKHKCTDGKHKLYWEEGNYHNMAMTFEGEEKHGPYCHWCGESLDKEEDVATE